MLQILRKKQNSIDVNWKEEKKGTLESIFYQIVVVTVDNLNGPTRHWSEQVLNWVGGLLQGWQRPVCWSFVMYSWPFVKSMPHQGEVSGTVVETKQHLLYSAFLLELAGSVDVARPLLSSLFMFPDHKRSLAMVTPISVWSRLMQGGVFSTSVYCELLMTSLDFVALRSRLLAWQHSVSSCTSSQ